MRTGIGCLLMLAGVALGLYVGVWWGFIGGIIAVIEQVRSPALSAPAVAYGVARVVFSGILGYVSAAFLLLPGAAMTGDKFK